MKNLFVIFILMVMVVGCDHLGSVQKPSEGKVPDLVQSTGIDLRKEIEKIVDGSPACSNYYWKNRGKAPRSYMNGMALMYAKQVCGQGSNFIKSEKITGKNSISNYEDALNYYGLSGNELNTYTFLIGLGMRESTGKYCTGRDRSQNYTKSDSAEAGIFQMAYVARVFNSELKPLYLKFKNSELNCELDSFKSEQIKCTDYDAKSFGTGEGAEWQELMKKCPAASTQWAAILIRSQYRHFGPIKRKEVEFKNECKDMLVQVEKIAKTNCSQL